MSALGDFLKEKYGNIRVASATLGVPYSTLVRNARKPGHGWQHTERILAMIMEERDDALRKLQFAQEEYERLAKLYNATIDKYAQIEDERI